MKPLILTPSRVVTISLDGFNAIALEPGQNYGLPPGLAWLEPMITDGTLLEVEVPDGGPFQAWDLSRAIPVVAPLVQGHFYYQQDHAPIEGLGESSTWIPSRVPEGAAPPSKLLPGLPPRRQVQPAPAVPDASPEAAKDAPIQRAPKRARGAANA